MDGPAETNEVRRADVMPLLVEACPSFQALWDERTSDPDYVPDLLHADLSLFAGHVVTVLETGPVDELPSIFDAVERLLVEGDVDVKEATTIGLLEDIQNAALRACVPLSSFAPHLGRSSAVWWDEVVAFWEGRRQFVGAGVEEQ